MISLLSSSEAEARIEELAGLLINVVDGGASVGFLPPLTRAQAVAYWRDVVDAMRAGTRILIAAVKDDRLLGSVQLALETRANGDHRAELIKLMVDASARRRGVARLLIAEVEAAATARNRTLLLMDTRKGSEAERLFDSLGYVRFGEVPEYARSSDGRLHTTSFFYRELVRANESYT